MREPRPERKKRRRPDLPSVKQLESELEWENYHSRFRASLRATLGTLVVVSAIAILVAVLLLPILRIYGSSMAPTLQEGDIVVSVKGASFEPGEIVAFYYNNKILVKRVIARPGEWVDIREDGEVFLNNTPLSEPYLQEKAFGICDIDLPYQVPEARFFVMGDYRDVSVDSRSTTIGCVAEEQVVGKIVFRIWPLERFGQIR